METIEYDKNSLEVLKSRNIFVDDCSVIADGVRIGSNVSIVNSLIGEGCIVNSNSVIENSYLNKFVTIISSNIYNSRVGEGSTIGPFAHLRDDANLGKNVRIGNFVEVKKSTIGSNTKIAHLTYVGDAEIGDKCNIGCGVVFCNYDGKKKQRTKIGDNVFIGSNVNLIAPLTVESGAYIAAGSTITRDIDECDFAIARSKQEIKKNFKNPYFSQ